ncbi:hypothetical protein VHEMI05229 [[Torrubiella] hemipterigena]|uniref:PH domain-containing protein n=1 Tax=[Torrubiella] hemipterigena TaxID=1531966 RepID=A0A0A1T3G7_9HYPO|nr:hypothetical protein VHEMI05229 [[Torrubiella] hemipterigena]
MAPEQVQPLQITKSTPKAMSTPTKMPGGFPRPLSEISPAEQRRNSPSWRHSAPAKKPVLSNDSSPFQSSPMDGMTSPRSFWQSRNVENIPYTAGPPSPSPQRRSSIERLQRASRVKNSNILALEQKQEYDPTRIPQIERPLSKVQGNTFNLSVGSPTQRSADTPQIPDFKRSDSSKPSFSMMSPGKLGQPEAAPKRSTPRAPVKDFPSPTKSALSPSKFKDIFDPETGTWSAHTSYNEDDFASGLSTTAERMLHSPQRHLPTPPPATTSKTDIQNIGNSKMTLEERLKLMMLSDENDAKSAAEQQRERRLRRGNGRERTASPQVNTATEEYQEEDTLADFSILGEFQMPAKISRESIMRRVNGNKVTERQSDFNFSSPVGSPERNQATRELSLDPDVPIPSTENLNMGEIEEMEEPEDDSVIIHRDSEVYEEVLDLYEVELDEDETEAPAPTVADVKATTEPQSAPQPSPAETHAVSQKSVSAEPPVQKEDTVEPAPTAPTALQSLMTSLGKEELKKTPSPVEPIETLVSEPAVQRPQTPEKRTSKPEYDGTGWGEPDDEYEDVPGTPESVLHHTVDDAFYTEEPAAIPEQMATIKASGSKLKTRISNTPSDLAAMREARRQVSHEVPHIPPIPAKHQNRLSRDASLLQEELNRESLDNRGGFKSRGLTLDIDAGLSLDQDFERVIEAQKRGYLMRQNTKVIAASDQDGQDARRAGSANNSPIKEEDRPESWTVEPWNGQMRRKSTRRGQTSGALAKSASGRQSHATSHAIEDDLATDNGVLDGNERGRLFVKVMGVKDLDLPLAKSERTWFNLTLDNGVHCVTTAWLELARNAPIGQEFELVVPNDLEFQLTLNVKLEKPAWLRNLPAPGKATKPTKSKTSAFSKVFASPKKRKEIELREREEERLAQEQKEALARQRNAAPSAYELLTPVVADDGSFARSYVCLKEHEQHCFGRPYTAEVVCFNEWASEEEVFAHSVKSKRGDGAVVRRAPYKIGKLELQLLFVPRPKNITDDDMPKSMNSCIRELKAAEEKLSRSYEGHLSQQGGDCPYWRRRYFKLVGSRLTAYHEATRQPRATINLANAKRLIDDRRALLEKETTGKGGRRRRSAFAEEEEGYMFVEEGFRIRFNNGEVIDFYADTADDKDGWMRILSDVIGRGPTNEDDSTRSKSKWCELVLRKEEQLRRRSSRRSSRRSHVRSKTSLT